MAESPVAVDCTYPLLTDYPGQQQDKELLGPVWTRMPAEIWERIIDCLYNEPRALRACEIVCKLWQIRSRFHLSRFETLTGLGSAHAVYQMAMWTREVPRYRAKVSQMSIFADVKDLAHVGAFAAMLVDILPHLTKLTLEHGEWPRWVPCSVFQHLTTYTTITRLDLVNITFPSITTFGRLVCALKGLQNLSTSEWDSIKFTDASLPKPLKRRWVPSPSLSQIQVNRAKRARCCEVDFLRALASTFPTTSCRHLILSAVSSTCIQSLVLQSLLKAVGPMLRSFTIGIPDFGFNYPTGPETYGLVRAIEALEAADRPALTDRALNLSKNTGLEKLRIRIPRLSITPGPGRYRFDWVSRLLSHVAPSSLQEVSLELVRFTLPETESMLISCLLEDCCVIDSIFSHPAFSRLQHIYFNLPGVWFSSEERDRALRTMWHDLASRWWPTLLRRGMLRLRLKPANDKREWVEMDWSDALVVTLS
ncbi:hypothetical protein WOLCODRAFT_139787 [Wolfiporia cocos MD-104 SS10]|uniref:F-box domain-containing protein n=1 Tax=Wolfiporia cocos (strain MD-104) TaxID=742152 RepID=A0A2H3J0F6_WOLCO|nr:hypothetical protein WOLCODRAFT_139787 [Wolfiporia cocos MD-104 SS10]